MRRPRRRPAPPSSPVAHGEQGIHQVGHRLYVGGMWDEMGRLQADFLIGQGLRPHHVLLDIGCGSLRAGAHLIPYLDRGHYLGIDKEALLIRAGVEEEVPREVIEEKAPELIVSGGFEFERFTRRPDFAIAQSLFSHLPPREIRLCLRRLRAVAPPHCRFFATFFEAPQPRAEQPRVPHDHVNWEYTRREMLAFGRRTGWDAEYVGDWGHPRGQVMVRYVPRRGPAAALARHGSLASLRR